METQRDTQRERLFYLEFLALFTGQVSRKDLVLRFGISEPAATKDLSLYAELAPDVLKYDLRKKCYVLSGSNIFFPHKVDQALYSLAGERAIAINTEHAKRLPSWVNTSIKRKMPLAIVAAITRCMYQKRKIIAGYTSISSGNRKRNLTPLALAHDGSRWHIRCYDHDKKEFRDHNLVRFTDVKEDEPSDVCLEQDRQWNKEVCLRLRPHPKSEHPEAVRMDYEFSGDFKNVSLKACLVGYFLRHWHIDFSDEAVGNPRAQQLYLDNKAELLECGVDAWAFEH